MKREIVFLILMFSLWPPFVAGTHDPNDFFALEANFPGTTFNAIHGTATNQWAVGTDGTQGVIYRRSGGAWTQVTGLPSSDPQPDGFLDVFARTDSDVWVVGGTRDTNVTNQNKILHWNGAAWSRIQPAATSPSWLWQAQTVWASGASDVIVAGSLLVPGEVGGEIDDIIQHWRIIRWNGASWSVDHEFGDTLNGAPPKLYGLYGLSSSEVYIVIQDGIAGAPTCRLWLYNGSIWTDIRTSSSDFGLPECEGGDVWGPSGSDLYVLFNTKRVVSLEVRTVITHKIGTSTYQTQTNPAIVPLYGVSGSSAADVWAVGDNGQIIHTTGGTGNTWTIEPAITGENLRGVYAASSSLAWIVGASGGIYKLQVNPPITHPTIAGLTYDATEGVIRVSHAQCLSDDIDFSIINGQGMVNDLDVYVIDGATDVVIEQIDDSQMFAIANSWWHFNRTYPAGSYQALMVIDIQSALSPDRFDVVPFNVPQGTCYTANDALEISNRFDQVDQSIAALKLDAQYINQTVLTINNTLNRHDNNQTSQHGYINSNVNVTSAAAMSSILTAINTAHGHIDAHLVYGYALLNQTHTHIDEHFTYTNALINDTRITVNLTHLNENLTAFINLFPDLSDHISNETGLFGLSSLPGFTQQDSTALILFALLMIISLTQGWVFLAFASLLGVLAQYGENIEAGVQFEHSFMISVGLVLIACWVESIVKGWRLKQVEPNKD